MHIYVPVIWHRQESAEKDPLDTGNEKPVSGGDYCILIDAYLKATMVLATAMVVISRAFRQAGVQMLPVRL